MEKQDQRSAGLSLIQLSYQFQIVVGTDGYTFIRRFHQPSDILQHRIPIGSVRFPLRNLIVRDLAFFISFKRLPVSVIRTRNGHCRR